MKLTQQRIDEVKALRAEGKTFAVIAEHIGLCDKRARQIAAAEAPSESDHERHVRMRQEEREAPFKRFALDLARKHKIPLRADFARGIK